MAKEINKVKPKLPIPKLEDDPGELPIIGDAAFEAAKNYSEVKEFEISFKQRLSKNSEFSEQIIHDFVKAVYLELGKSEQLNTQIKQHFFIGCPSGWKYEAQDNYKKLMLKAGLNNVVVTPESRAAFMHALENDTFTIRAIQKGILVIDIGSSTTDFTFVHDSICEDYGEHNYDLGASLIEKEILECAI